MLTESELAIAKRGLARSIAAGRTTIAAPISPAQYAALPEEPDQEPEPMTFYLKRGVRAGWLVRAGNKPTGYKENLYQLSTLNPQPSTAPQ